MRVKLLIDKLLPSETISRIDILEPISVFENTDMELPNLAKFLREQELPNCVSLRMETQLP
jgi:hypothetical protein